MTKEKVISKIRKLMEMTLENGASQGEAESALMMAQKLLAKHNLEMADVHVDDKDEEIIQVGSEEVITASWKIHLASMIADNFRCVMMLQGRIGSNTKTPIFVGYAEDAEICKEVFEATITWLYKARNKIYREYSNAGKITKGLKADYTIGVLKGLRENFEAQRTSTEYSLVLVTPTEVKEEVSKLSSGTYKGGNHGPKGGGHFEARQKGYQHGLSYGKKHLEG